MNFVWAGKRNLKNTKLVFTVDIEKPCDLLTVCATDFFRVFSDGKLIAFGPDRTASGFSRKKNISVNGCKHLIIEVLGYNIPCYECDFQLPFFGAVITFKGNTVYNTCDFNCYRDLSYVRKVPRFSSQRGFIEVYNLKKSKLKKIKTYSVDSPTIIDGLKDSCLYKEEQLPLIKQSDFFGFDAVQYPKWMEKKEYRVDRGAYNLDKSFIQKVALGAKAYDYVLETERTGFIKFKIKAKENVEIFAVMDELGFFENCTFRRLECNNIVVIKAPKGEYSLLTFEPYAFKYLRIICRGNADIDLSIVYLENDASLYITSTDQRINEILKSSRTTFNQNVLDIPMDCPSRERAGWLCDSYFMGLSENLFMGNNNVERAFLENILIANNKELDEGMLPKCFPAEHHNSVKDENRNNLYIPNWAMFFFIELESYYRRTGDKKTVDLAKEKAYKLIEFFRPYENELGLLENLDGWVFVEWSICNDKDYLAGVNFPTNILYADMLEKIALLYGDKALKEKSQKLKKQIKELSFNGEFFVDNAVREKGVLTPCINHISETCQYYALYFGIEADEKYKKTIEEKFGPKMGEDTYPNIGRSNMFIGFYLRLLWLCSRKNSANRILSEITEVMYPMAKNTGTLWEHNDSHASCNHGFASSIAVILLKALYGFEKTKDGKFIFDNDFNTTEHGIEIFINEKPLTSYKE